VERIRAATREQAEGNERVSQSSAELREVAQAVQKTVELQTRGAARIADHIASVQSAVREITEGLAEQVAASQQVSEVMKRSREHARSHHEWVARMDDAGRELEREAEALRSAVRRFRIQPESAL
jgi:methyl-accepting chemotaxis protein